MPENKPDDELQAPLKFEERVAHLGAGYSNSQSIAQFIDAKAAAVLGSVPVILTMLAAVFAWLDGWLPLSAIAGRSSCLFWVFAFLGIGVFATLLVLAGLTVSNAFKTISPRDTGKAEPSILFPFEPDDTTKGYSARVDRFVNGPATRGDALECYRRQSVRMSQILPLKFSNLKSAIIHLRRFFVCAAIAMFLMLLTAAIGVGASKRESKPSEPVIRTPVGGPATPPDSQ